MTRSVLADFTAHSFDDRQAWACTVVTVGDFDGLAAATKMTPPATRWADYPADEEDNYLEGLRWRQASHKPTKRLSLAAASINKELSSACCMVRTPTPYRHPCCLPMASCLQPRHRAVPAMRNRPPLHLTALGPTAKTFANSLTYPCCLAGHPCHPVHRPLGGAIRWQQRGR